MYHILRLQWCRLTLSSMSNLEFLSWEHSSSRDHCQNNESPSMWEGPIDMMYRVNLDSMQFNRGQHALSYQYVRESWHNSPAINPYRDYNCEQSVRPSWFSRCCCCCCHSSCFPPPLCVTVTENCPNIEPASSSLVLDLSESRLTRIIG